MKRFEQNEINTFIYFYFEEVKYFFSEYKG